jgi:hypothetical protein
MSSFIRETEMTKYVTIGAQYRAQDGAPVAERLDLLALQWSERAGREVSRTEVIKALLEESLAKYPIDESEAARLRALPKLARAPLPERPTRPRIVIATVNGQRVLQEKGCGDAGRRTHQRHKAA